MKAALRQAKSRGCIMSAPFQLSLQSKAEHGLHALRVSLMTAEMAEAESIGLECDARRIEGMTGCSLDLMLDPDTTDPRNRDLQRRAVGKRGGQVAMAVVKGEIQHIPAMAVVGKTLTPAGLPGLDLHRPVVNSVRSSLVMMIEQINQRHQHWLALLLLRIGSPVKAAGGQKSLGC